MSGAHDVGGDEFRAVPTARPALIALVVVVAVSMVMIFGTLIVGQQTSERAQRIATESIQSMQTLGMMRHRIIRLESASPERRKLLREQIARDVAEYEPLATAPGEAAEWARLNTVVKAYMASPPDVILRNPVVRDAQLDHIVASFERLKDINVLMAQRRIDRIERTQDTALIVQILGGSIILLAAGVVALILSRVMRRQRALTQRVLHSLAERNRELTEFARRTAHDLRGPLTPIRGYAELLADGASVDPRRAGERIRSASNTLACVIDNLLALSVTGNLPSGIVDVSPLVSGILEDMSDELTNVEIVTDLEDCKAACAPSVLGQLLQNVLSNASKYRDPTRPLSIRIGVKRVDSKVELRVRDNGLGMSDETVAHAFDPMYRGPVDAKIPGHGLGLAIVKRTLDAMGGTCSLSSERDRGTEVVMCLPAAA